MVVAAAQLAEPGGGAVSVSSAALVPSLAFISSKRALLVCSPFALMRRSTT